MTGVCYELASRMETKGTALAGEAAVNDCEAVNSLPYPLCCGGRVAVGTWGRESSQGE